MIKDDKEAIEKINKLYKLVPASEEEWSEVLISLEDYQPGLSEVLIRSKILLNPEEALALARKHNKPIIL